MSYDLSELLVIGISSRALFDLGDEDRIFQTEGLQAFIDYQRANEDVVLRPGSAFPLVNGLLGLNDVSGIGALKMRSKSLERSEERQDFAKYSDPAFRC
jgi:hypothetical protein